MCCVSSGELISGCYPPGRCQTSRIPENLVSNCECAHSLVEDAISGAGITPFLPALATALLPLCLWWEMGQSTTASSPLVFVSPLFCEWAWQCLRLEIFAGKFSLSLFFFSLSLYFFSLSGYLQFGLLSHVSFLSLSSGHSGQVLILSMQPVPPLVGSPVVNARI